MIWAWIFGDLKTLKYLSGEQIEIIQWIASSYRREWKDYLSKLVEIESGYVVGYWRLIHTAPSHSSIAPIGWQANTLRKPTYQNAYYLSKSLGSGCAVGYWRLIHAAPSHSSIAPIGWQANTLRKPTNQNAYYLSKSLGSGCAVGYWRLIHAAPSHTSIVKHFRTHQKKTSALKTVNV